MSSLHRHAGAPRPSISAPSRRPGPWSRSARTTACTVVTATVIAPGARSSPTSGACRRAVVTFDRHPASVVRPESAPPLLTDLDQKLELLDEHRRRLHARRPLRRGALEGAGRGVRHRGAGRLPRRPGRSSWATTSTSATSAGATSACCATMGAELGFEVRRARAGRRRRRSRRPRPTTGCRPPPSAPRSRSGDLDVGQRHARPGPRGAGRGRPR